MKRLVARLTLAVAAMVLLSGCKVAFHHVFEEDGSSVWEWAVGDEFDEDSDGDLECGADGDDNEFEFDIVYTNRFTRRNEIWCAIGIGFGSPQAAADGHLQFNEGADFEGIRVHCMSVVDGHLIYDIEVFLEAGDVEPGDALTWAVTAPGGIQTSNADSVSGDTATWNLLARSGWTRLQVNAEECPISGVTLDLTADSATTGTAQLTLGKPATGSRDVDALRGAVEGAGWPVNDDGERLTSTRAWGSSADLDQMLADLPFLAGSDTSVSDDGDDASSFDLRLDLSAYVGFWAGINDSMATPDFRLTWSPPPGSVNASGDWTDPATRVFTWTAADGGGAYDLVAEVTPEETDDGDGTVAEGDDETDEDEDDGAVGAGDGDDDGTDPDDDPEDGDGDEAAAPTAEEEAAATDALVDEFAGEDADDATRAATAAAVVALLGAAGLTAVSMAEAGLSIAEVLAAVRSGDIGSLRPAPPDDDPVPPGGIRIWDEAAGRARVFDNWEDAERFTAGQRADQVEQFESDTADAMAASRELYDAANQATLDDIRADQALVDYWTQLVAAREAALARLEAAEAEQVAIAGEDWQDIVDDAFDGMLRDLDGLPAEIREAAWHTRQALDAVAEVIADPTNYDPRVLAETTFETIYDVLGVMAGGTFGDGVESIKAPVEATLRVGGALAEIAWERPGEFFEMITPIGDLKDSMDPDKTLGQRLGHMGFALADILGTMAGVGLADEALEGARLADKTADAVEAARTAERTTDVIEGVRDVERASDVSGTAVTIDRLADSDDFVLATASPEELADLQRRAGTISTKFDETTVAARQQAWEAAQREGREAVAELRKLPDDELARRQAVLRVQSNKQALLEMKDADKVGVELQRTFNRDLRGMYNETDQKVLDWLMDPDRRPKGLPDMEPPLTRVVDDVDPRLLDGPDKTMVGIYEDANGNRVRLFEPTNADPDVVSVGADRDFAVYVTPKDGAEISVPHAQVREVYEEAFFEAAGGPEMARSLGIEPNAHEFANRMDQMITDDLHPEAYKNVQAVIHGPGQEIGEVQQVGQTVAYKHDHWQERALSSNNKAAEAAAAGDDELAAVWRARAEDEAFEGTRQLVKQNGNQLQARYDALAGQVEQAKAAGTLPDTYKLKPIPDDLQRAIAIMDESKTAGVSPVQVEMLMVAELKMTPTDAARRMGDYTESMEKMRPQAIVDISGG